MWIFAGIGAYFLQSIVALFDKFLLKQLIPKPAVYAFYVSALSIVGIVFFIFDLRVPSFAVLAAGILAGAIYVYALIAYYTALRGGEASRVAPLVGGMISLFTFLLARILLGESLSANQIFAFIIIVAGGYLLAAEHAVSHTVFPLHTSASRRILFFGVLGAFLFAVTQVFIKFAYTFYAFTGGFALRALGAFLGGMTLLLIPSVRREIFDSFKVPHRTKGGVIFLAGQATAAASFVLLNYAFSIGSVTLVSAFAGVQYAFVFLFTVLLSRLFPNVIKENTSLPVLVQKSAGIFLVAAGTFFLFLRG